MSITCSFPCRCKCLTAQVQASIPVGSYNYSPGSCATSTADESSSPGTYCCNGYPGPDTGHNKLMNDGGIFQLSGVGPQGEEPGVGCNCFYTGTFMLYKNGDYRLDSMEAQVLLYIYDDGITYSEITFDGDIYSGYGNSSLNGCMLICTDRTITPNVPPLPDTVVDTPRLGGPAGIGLTNAINRTDFTLYIGLQATVAQEACKSTCIVSQRVDSQSRIVISTALNGRCPKVISSTSSTFPTEPGALCPFPPDGESVLVCQDSWKYPGWHCREYSPATEYNEADPPVLVPVLDCHGNAESILYEYITHRDSYWDGGPELPCTLDCCDVLDVYDYQNSGFYDVAAWWTISTVGWSEEAAGECAKAARNGVRVWRFEIECTYYYLAEPLDEDGVLIPMYLDPPDNTEKNPDWPWPVFVLGTPCSASCIFYSSASYPPELPCPPDDETYVPLTGIYLTALPGEILKGVDTGDSLVLMSQHTRYQVSGGVTLCDIETYMHTCAINVSPIAPNVTLELYPCPNCHPGCFRSGALDALPKEGYNPNAYGTGIGNWYEETFYAATRAEAVDKAMTRAAEIKLSEGVVIPYAHLLTPVGGTNNNAGNDSTLIGSVSGGPNGNSAAKGCCHGEWAAWVVTINSWPKWADLAHVTPCEYGIKYNSTSTEPIPAGQPHEGEYATTLIMCCQCLLPHWLCDSCEQGHFLGEVSDSGYTDFFGGPADVKILSVVDPDSGEYCRDFDTPAGLAAAWSGYAATAKANACWAWFSEVHGVSSAVEPWDYVHDFGGYDPSKRCTGGDPNGVSLNCAHTVTNHGVVTYGARYYSEPAYASMPATGYQLTCKQDSDGFYYWTGLYRECRWCPGKCNTASSLPPGTCPSDPCLRSFSGSCYVATGSAAAWTPLEDCCSNTEEAKCMQWLGYRSNYDAADNNRDRRPWVLTCDASLTASLTGITAGIGCGRHYCANKCGVDFGGDTSRYMYNGYNEGCSIYASIYDGTMTPGPETLTTMWTDAQEMCRNNTIYKANPAYTTCETAAEACADDSVSIDEADYYMQITDFIYEDFGWKEHYEDTMPISPWINKYKKPLTTYCSSYLNESYELIGGVWVLRYTIKWNSCDMSTYVCCWLPSWTNKITCT